MSAAASSFATRNLAVLLLAGASLAACATPQPRFADRLPGPHAAPPAGKPSGAGATRKIGQPYQVGGIWYVPREQPDYDVVGTASWYGEQFNNQRTADGEIFDMNLVSGAHTTLPLPSIVEVTNLDNGRKLNVRINDRGPFVGGRVIDLSKAAARELGYERQGLARVRVRYVGPAMPDDRDLGVRYASNTPPPPLRAVGDATAIPDLPEFRPPAAPVAVAASLPPITGSAIAPARAAPPPVTVSTKLPEPTVTSIGGAYWIQAGAFSDPANARRVADSLGPAGQATVEPVTRNGVTLYRVMLPGGADEGEAWSLRNRVAELGFGDARVLPPF